MSQQFRKTILIVCEGERTEPDYFEKIRNNIISINEDIYIKIDPIPKNEKDEQERIELENQRQGRKSRQIKNTHIQFTELEVEDEYLTQPVFYVRKAQLGLVDSVYDEVWAVYDKDGHAAHEQAFDLAKNIIEEKKVNVAFNSIAFEYWILLHFESNSTSFEKSMCRTNLPDDKKEYHFCGENTHALDCQGVSCVCGRIVNQNYLSYVGGKKEFLFSEYFGMINQAIERAVNLKNSYIGSTLPVYDLNPYTTTHRIVFKLLQLPEVDYTWFEYGDIQNNENLMFNLDFASHTISITVTKSIDQTEIVNEEDFCLIDRDGNKLNCGQRKVMIENVFTFSIDLSIISNFTPLFIGIRKNEKEYLITELPI